IYAICQRFVKFSRTNLKSLLRENLQRTRRLNLQNYNMKQLFRLSKLSFSNDISAGLNHSIMIANTGQVYVCGSDSNGQLGTQGFKHIGGNKQTLIPKLNNISQVSAGNYHSLFLTNNGLIYACGSNFYGQLGLQSNNNVNISILIKDINNISQISAGSDHSLTLNVDNQVHVFGYNDDGQLGLGNTKSLNIPILLPE